MATVTKCDRCGAVFNEHKFDRTIPGGGHYFPGQLCVRNRSYVPTEYFDLCDDCFGKLFEFIEGEHKEEAEVEHGEEAEG